MQKVKIENSIKKYLGILGFKKKRTVFIKEIRSSYYIAVKIKKEVCSFYDGETDINFDTAYFYDLLFDIVGNIETDLGSDAFSLCIASKTSSNEWTSYRKSDDVLIANDIIKKFNEYCFAPLTSEACVKPSLYDFYINNCKKCERYLFWFDMLWLSEMACVEMKKDSALFWYVKSIDEYYDCYLFQKFGIYAEPNSAYYDLYDLPMISEVELEMAYNKLDVVIRSNVMPEEEISWFKNTEMFLNQLRA
ncbi:MAG: hypothetical protein E7558_02165 [Ruminococcaceae bacterium]|nr:hypothetical protein [Oscillospiraceae bacterium]